MCSFAHLNILFLLASLRYGFFFAALPRRPAYRSRLFTVDVETGVLRVLFNEAASRGLVRRLFLKLHSNVLVLLLSCHWNTGVMFADNGPLYTYVDIPLK